MVPGVRQPLRHHLRRLSAPSCGLVVKQRDGRPIKIEGNEASPLTGGGTCAAGQASVLSLYDDARLRGPVLGWGTRCRGARSTAHRGDARRAARGDRAHDRAAVADDHQPVDAGGDRRRSAPRFPSFRHVVYDPMSLAALREANRRCLRRRRRPALPFRPGARRRRAGGRLPRDLAGAGGVRAAVGARARTADATRGIPRPVRVGRCRSRAATPTCGWRCAPSELGAGRGGAARRGRAPLSRHAALAAAVPPARRPRRTPPTSIASPTRWSRHRGESLVVTRQRRRRGADRGRARSTRCWATSARRVDRRRARRCSGRATTRAMPALIDDMQRGAVRALHALGRQPGLRSPGRRRVPRGAGQGRR